MLLHPFFHTTPEQQFLISFMSWCVRVWLARKTWRSFWQRIKWMHTLRNTGKTCMIWCVSDHHRVRPAWYGTSPIITGYSLYGE
jgi:hypothetical protein